MKIINSFEDNLGTVQTTVMPNSVIIARVKHNNIGEQIEMSKDVALKMAMDILQTVGGEFPEEGVIEIPGAFHDALPTFITLSEYAGNDLLHIEQEEQNHNNRVILARSEVEQMIPALIQALEKMVPEIDNANA